MRSRIHWTDVPEAIRDDIESFLGARVLQSKNQNVASCRMVGDVSSKPYLHIRMLTRPTSIVVKGESQALSRLASQLHGFCIPLTMVIGLLWCSKMWMATRPGFHGL
jgi:hypothetical protein